MQNQISDLRKQKKNEFWAMLSVWATSRPINGSGTGQN